MMPDQEIQEKALPNSQRKKWFKITLALVILTTLVIAVRLSPLAGFFQLSNIREIVLSAGAFGVVIFILLNTVSMIIHLPGMIFPVSAMLIYGNLKGFAIAFIASYLAINTSFLFFRFLSRLGKANLHSIKKPQIQKILDRIETNPLLSVALLRTLAGVTPPLNSTLALTNVHFRHHVLGSVSVIFPVAFFCTLTYFFQDRVLEWIS